MRMRKVFCVSLLLLLAIAPPVFAKTFGDITSKGDVIVEGNVGLGSALTLFGDQGEGVLSLESNTLPTSSPDGCVQLYAEGVPVGTVALIQFNALDGATTYTAETGQTVTFAGDAQIDTAMSVHGGSSLKLDGTTDYVTLPASTNWNFPGDFTIRLKANLAGINSTIIKSVSSDAYGDLVEGDWLLSVNGSGYLTFLVVGGGVCINSSYPIAAGSGWHDIAVSRTSGVVKAYIDGQLGNGTGASAQSIGNTNVLNIGLAESAYTASVNGWIDEVLIVNGKGLYPEAFTPRDRPFNIDTMLEIKDSAGNTNTIPSVSRISFTITKPLDLDEAATLPVWKNRSGRTFNITAIHSDADVDDVNFTLKKARYTDYTALTTIEAVAITTDGSGVYYNDLTSGIDNTTIENENVLLFDNDATDDPAYVCVTLVGYYN